MRASTRQRIRKKAIPVAMALLRAVLFTALTFVVIYPLLTKFCASFMALRDVHDMSVRYIPRHPTLSHYRDVWRQLELSAVYPLTVQFTALVALLQTLSATVAGYGLARFRFRLNGVFLALALVGTVVPPDLLLVPLFSEFRYFDPFGLVSLVTGGAPPSLIGTQWPLILLAVTCTGYRCGLFIFILRQFFRGMPRELEEAAYIDGAGPVRAFLRIMLPGARTMMVTVFLFGFVWTWLDIKYIPTLMPDMPLLVTEVQKISALGLDASANTVARSLLVNAGAVYLIVPLILLYLFTQRYFVQSIERSGLVG